MTTRFTITNEGPGLIYIETIGQSLDFGRDTVLSTLKIPVGASMDAHVYPGHSFRVREAEKTYGDTAGTFAERYVQAADMRGEQGAIDLGGPRGTTEIDYTIDHFAVTPVSGKAVQ